MDPAGNELPVCADTRSRGNAFALLGAHEQSGIRITPETAQSQWLGGRMNDQLAVGGLPDREQAWWRSVADPAECAFAKEPLQAAHPQRPKNSFTAISQPASSSFSNTPMNRDSRSETSRPLFSLTKA